MPLLPGRSLNQINYSLEIDWGFGICSFRLDSGTNSRSSTEYTERIRMVWLCNMCVVVS